MNGKLKEAANAGEQLAAILVMAVHKNALRAAAAQAAGKHEETVLSADDYLKIVAPFLELAEVRAQMAVENAGKVIGLALRERALTELGTRETRALFGIAEIIRRLETPEIPWA